jgi:hypothetical protein
MMNGRKYSAIEFLILALVLFVAALRLTKGQDNDDRDKPNAYPEMAPLDRYLMDGNAEIALARSAAPEALSRDATILVLGRHGYETALAGKERLRMRRGALVDASVRRFGILESPRAFAALPKSARRAVTSATHFQDDRVGIGWAV